MIIRMQSGIFRTVNNANFNHILNYISCSWRKTAGMATTAAPVKVDFYFDVISPYSYLAFEIISKYNPAWKNMNLQYQPVSLAAIVNHSGNTPPGMLPARGKYMSLDLRRLTDYYNVPFRMYQNPFDMMMRGSLQASRLMSLVIRDYSEYAEDLIRNIFQLVWLTHDDITLEDNLIKACLIVGFSKQQITELLLKSKDVEAKQMLKTQTNAALEHGAYGAPSFVAHIPQKKPMLFFGSDRIFLLGHFIGEKWNGNEVMNAKL